MFHALYGLCVEPMYVHSYVRMYVHTLNIRTCVQRQGTLVLLQQTATIIVPCSRPRKGKELSLPLLLLLSCAPPPTKGSTPPETPPCRQLSQRHTHPMPLLPLVLLVA